VRHGDFTVRAEREVPRSPKRQQAGTHLFSSSQKFSCQVSNPGDPAPAASLMDRKPQVFEIHGPRLEVGPALRQQRQGNVAMNRSLRCPALDASSRWVAVAPVDGGRRLRQHAKVIERISLGGPHAAADGGGGECRGRRVNRRSGAGHWQVMECNALSGGVAGTGAPVPAGQGRRCRRLTMAPWHGRTRPRG
jgi:hypothetical protein